MLVLMIENETKESLIEKLKGIQEVVDMLYNKNIMLEEKLRLYEYERYGAIHESF